jgi:hypothetical protein
MFGDGVEIAGIITNLLIESKAGFDIKNGGHCTFIPTTFATHLYLPHNPL